jgi:hypothetical protein
LGWWDLGICCSNHWGSMDFALQFRGKKKIFAGATCFCVIGFSGVIRGWLATCLVAWSSKHSSPVRIWGWKC